jgi:hypothetical protein
LTNPSSVVATLILAPGKIMISQLGLTHNTFISN